MFEPALIINFYAITVSALICFSLGWLWYGPLFGKIWLREMGGEENIRPEPRVIFRAIILNLAGLFLTCYALTYFSQVWRPSVWGIPGVADAPDYFYGFLGSFFIWGGFYIPALLNGVAYENRSWKFFSINAFYNLACLLIAGQILEFWR
jgi:hypothetical protein